LLDILYWNIFLISGWHRVIVNRSSTNLITARPPFTPVVQEVLTEQMKSTTQSLAVQVSRFLTVQYYDEFPCDHLNKNTNLMYFVFKILKNFICIIPLYMFRTPLCPSSGASQLHMQSLVPINYKNTFCLQICHYVRFIITTNYFCDTYKLFLASILVLFCFVFSFGSVGFVSCIILLLHTVWCLIRCVLQSCCVLPAVTI